MGHLLRLRGQRDLGILACSMESDELSPMRRLLADVDAEKATNSVDVFV